MDRREFIKNSAVIAAGVGLGLDQIELKAADAGTAAAVAPASEPAEESAQGKLITSAPMLQNYAAESIGVAFSVSAMANGYVLVADNPEMENARKIKCGGYRVTDMNDKVMLVRVTGLKPATRYWYRIGADRINYGGGYAMSVIGNEEPSEVYSFVTAGAAAEASFCVMNDLHEDFATLSALVDKIETLNPSCVINNGDFSNTQETVESQVALFLDPDIRKKDYAASRPYMLCPGNHDSRGFANRHLEKVWMFRQPEERPSRDWDLGRNFAVRMGDIAMIGLDTAEDKLDTNPVFAGLFNSGAYREAQAVWLADALAQPEIASAPYLVAFCHIPLFCNDPHENPGDIEPADWSAEYTHAWASWQRTCSKLWGPLLDKAGCQLLIAAHQHDFRYDAAETGRSWAQIVGGGSSLEAEHSFPTLIDGRVKDGKLQVTVYNMHTDSVQEIFSFSPRKHRRRS